MLRHNILIILRTFKRFKSTFLINLTGLSVGIACALMIYLWVMDEMSFDKFHEKSDRIYQIMQNLPEGNAISTTEHTPHPLAGTLREEYPEVEYVTTAVLSKWFANKGVLTFENTHVKAAGQFISKDYFNIFSCDFIRGGKESILSHKYNIAISDEMAIALFGTLDGILGRSVEWKLVDSGTDFTAVYQISGVFKRQPVNTSAPFDLLLNYELFFEKRSSLIHWANSDPFTYIVLRDGVNPGEFSARIAGLRKEKYKDFRGSLFLRKYSDQYLYGEYENGVQSGGRIEYVKIFSFIGIFLLLIASINFMNLSTARASTRLKEVGIKKAIGASKRALIIQHLGEALLMSLIAFILAIVVVQLLLPAFNTVTGKTLVLGFEKRIFFSLIGIVLVTGLLSGSYPAFYLSGFSPVSVLKGKLATSFGEVWTRKGLVIFQFVIAITLIVSVFIVYKQLEYIRSKNLGYNKDNLIYFDVSGVSKERVHTFLVEAKKIPGVAEATTFNHNLSGIHGGYSGLQWEGKNPDEDIHFGNLEVGYDFLRIMGIQLVEGEYFSRDLRPESQIIFNEEAIKRMGLRDPVGKTIDLFGEKRIVGIARDFHFESLHQNIEPCFFQLTPNRDKILLKVEAGSEQPVIDKAEQLYQVFNPGVPFDFKFMDEDYHLLYASEQKVSVLSKYFSGIAIFVSCLGLYGLAAFSAERRSKEIGIRKVLGSSATKIVLLLSGDFTKTVFAAILIALPVSYYVAYEWLARFAYRIPLSWWYFILAGVLTLCIAWLTVGTQAVRAARMNPARSLKDD